MASHASFLGLAQARRILPAIALLAGAGAALAGPADHTPVSSDGVSAEWMAVDAAPRAGFKGVWKPGQSPDALAEFPASRLSAEELAAFQAQYKPKQPPYATDVAPESVVGSDRRFRIYPQESGYPYRAVGLLTFTQGSGSFTCTGWLISANTVATAGHCVHSGGSGGVWSTNVKFYPARNGASSPYGSCTGTRLHSVSGWTSSANDEYDYGAVRLNCSIGTSTGWLGRWWTTASQVNLPIVIVGYPGDKPSSTQWGGAGRVALSETRKTRYAIDTAGGQSGAPVIQADGSGVCEGDCGIAIHAYAASGGNNSGTRITQTVNSNLQSWIDRP